MLGHSLRHRYSADLCVYMCAAVRGKGGMSNLVFCSVSFCLFCLGRISNFWLHFVKLSAEGVSVLITATIEFLAPVYFECYMPVLLQYIKVPVTIQCESYSYANENI